MMYTEEIIEKKVKAFGGTGHITLPKRYIGRKIIVMVMGNYPEPHIHAGETIVRGGKTLTRAEIVTNAGTHSIYVDTEKLPNRQE